jgi:hypothetical protein
MKAKHVVLIALGMIAIGGTIYYINKSKNDEKTSSATGSFPWWWKLKHYIKGGRPKPEPPQSPMYP